MPSSHSSKAPSTCTRLSCFVVRRQLGPNPYNGKPQPTCFELWHGALPSPSVLEHASLNRGNRRLLLSAQQLGRFGYSIGLLRFRPGRSNSECALLSNNLQRTKYKLYVSCKDSAAESAVPAHSGLRVRGQSDPGCWATATHHQMEDRPLMTARFSFSLSRMLSRVPRR